MPRKKSPEITIFEPPTTDCPTVSARKIKTSELDEVCARSVAEEILTKKKGQPEWTIDFFTDPVRMEIEHPNGTTQEFEWDPSEFRCIERFLNDIRSRLHELIDTQFLALFESAVESIIERIRSSCIRVEVEDVEIERVPSEADLAIEGIRDSLGLTQLRQPGRRLANLRRTDLRRVPRDQRSPIRLARRIATIPEILELILR